MPEFTMTTVESQTIVYVPRTSSIAPEAIGACMGEAFGTLMGFMGQHGIEATGAPMAIYHGYGETETTFDPGRFQKLASIFVDQNKLFSRG